MYITVSTANIYESLSKQARYRTSEIRSSKNTIENVLDSTKKELSHFATSNLSTMGKEFYVYLNSLELQDKKEVESSLNVIKSYPFVEDIQFKNYGTPTIVIKIAEINKEYEDHIYAIEYNLLRKTNADIDFYIQTY